MSVEATGSFSLFRELFDVRCVTSLCVKFSTCPVSSDRDE